MHTGIPTQEDLKILYEQATEFAEQWFLENANVAVGYLPRMAYHAARRQGFGHDVAGFVEAKVGEMVKAERVDAKRRASEWLCDFQAAGR